VDQLHADAANGVGIHVVVLTRVLLAYVPPGSGLPYVIAELLIIGYCLIQVVHRHAQMLNALRVLFEEVGVDVRRRRGRGNPFVTELVVILVANLKRKPQWFVPVG
jgi:hypothetical protein